MSKLRLLTTAIAVLVNAGKAREKHPVYEVLPSCRARTAVHRDLIRILFPKETQISYPMNPCPEWIRWITDLKMDLPERNATDQKS